MGDEADALIDYHERRALFEHFEDYYPTVPLRRKRPPTNIRINGKYIDGRKDNAMPLTEEQKTAVGEAIGAEPKPDRLEVQWNWEKDPHKIYKHNPKARGKSHNEFRSATILSYTVNEGARTPSNGLFVSRRLTVSVRDEDGSLSYWVGQTKKGTNVVRLRPRDENK